MHETRRIANDEIDYDVTVDEGKYRAVVYRDGRLKVYRNGEEWQDLTGNKFVFALVSALASRQRPATDPQRPVPKHRSDCEDTHARENCPQQEHKDRYFLELHDDVGAPEWSEHVAVSTNTSTQGDLSLTITSGTGKTATLYVQRHSPLWRSIRDSVNRTADIDLAREAWSYEGATRTGTVCIACSRPQVESPDGVTCINGHVGASGVDLPAAFRIVEVVGCSHNPKRICDPCKAAYAAAQSGSI